MLSGNVGGSKLFDRILCAWSDTKSFLVSTGSSVVPATVGIMAATLPLGTAMGSCALCSYAVAFLAAIALPETIGADLHAQSPAAPDARVTSKVPHAD